MTTTDSVVQKVINSFSEGAGIIAVRAILVFIAIVGAYSFYGYRQFRGLTNPVGMDAAQLARNFAEHGSFHTRCVRPFDAGLVRTDASLKGPSRQPDLRHPPLHPALLGLGMRWLKPSYSPPGPGSLFEPESHVIIPLGILFCLLTGIMVFVCGRRLFSVDAGIVGMCMFLASDSVCQISLSGTAIPLALFLVMLSVYMAIVFVQCHNRAAKPYSWVLPWLLSALLAGAAGLTDYRTMVIAFATAAFAATAFTRGRTWTFLLYILIACGVMLPWLLRNQALAGNPLGAAPFTAFHDTFLFPADSLDRTMHATFDNTLVISALRTKIFSRLPTLLNAGLGGGLVTCLFLVSFFHAFEERAANALRWSLLAATAGLLIISALGPHENGNALILLYPFAALLGAALLISMLQRITIEDEWKIIIMTGVVLLTAVPALLRATVLPAANPYPPVFAPFISYTAELLEEDELVATDIPAAYAWYGNRTAVLLPQSTTALESLHAEWRPFSGLYLSPATSDRPWMSQLAEGSGTSWHQLLNRQVPDSFPLKHAVALPPDSVAQVFLTDRVRWVETTPSKVETIDEDATEAEATDGERP